MNFGSQLIQSATTVAAPSLPASLPEPAAGVAVRFRLIVLEAQLSVASGVGEAAVVAPGASYTVRVEVIPESVKSAENYAVAAAMSAALLTSEASLEVDGAPFTFTNAALGRDFRLQVGTAPVERVVQLELRAVFAGARPVVVASRALLVRGSASPSAEFRAHSSIELDKRPAEAHRIAILHMALDGTDLVAFGFHPAAGELPRTRIPRPDVHLLDAGNGQDTQAIVAQVRRLSRRSLRGVQQWLDRVRQTPDVALVIAEHTDSRIPWEMIELSTQEALGAAMVLVRWTLIGDYGDIVKLDTERHEHRGQALAFGDYAQLRFGALEQAELALLASDHDPRIDEVRNRLAALPSDVALLFVSAHGFEQQRDGSGLLTQAGRKLSADDLELADSLAPPRPFAFLNACYSGRIAGDAYQCSGLPEVFLGKFARSFLGSLGAVDQEIAATIGARVLSEARQNPAGVNIPSLLLELRRAAAENAQPLDPLWRHRFVNTFMYVFYGSPDTWLKLEKRAGHAR